MECVRSEKRSSRLEIKFFPRISFCDKEGFLLREKSSSRYRNHYFLLGRYSLGPIFSGNPPPTGRISLVQEDRFLSV